MLASAHKSPYANAVRPRACNLDYKPMSTITHGYTSCDDRYAGPALPVVARLERFEGRGEGSTQQPTRGRGRVHKKNCEVKIASGQGSSGRGADFVTVIGPFGSEQQCNAYRAQVAAEPNARAAYACWNAKDQS